MHNNKYTPHILHQNCVSAVFIFHFIPCKTISNFFYEPTTRKRNRVRNRTWDLPLLEGRYTIGAISVRFSDSHIPALYSFFKILIVLPSLPRKQLSDRTCSSNFFLSPYVSSSQRTLHKIQCEKNRLFTKFNSVHVYVFWRVPHLPYFFLEVKNAPCPFLEIKKKKSPSHF